MNEHIKDLRKYVPSAAAALLFTALLAQAPHAAAVFIRIAPNDMQWEVQLSMLGGIVYAIALESATAYFVWRNNMRWAIWFAVFSILHNVAYYMPGAWAFIIAGAELSLRYIVSALLISASLPIAIAAFSHVQAENGKTAKEDEQNGEGENQPAETPTTHTAPKKTPSSRGDVPSATTGHSDVVPTAEQAGETDVLTPPTEQAQDVPTHDTRTQAMQLRDEGYTAAEIARMTGAKYSTVQSWLRRASVQTNGVAHQ
jgi:hypothetical protein